MQYLRGVAALLVVLYHSIVQLEKFGIEFDSARPLRNGVDLFFVISGFVMWITTSERPIGTWEFYRHRIVRIVPLYWAVTTFMLVLLLIAPWAFKSSRFELWHVVSSYLFIPAQHPVKHSMEPLLFPGWTLNYEMFFYAVFGLLLIAQSRLFRISGLVSVFGLIVCLAPLATSDIGAFYTRSIVLEFAAGSLLGYFYVNGARLPVAASWLLIGFGTILIFSTSITGNFMPDAVSRGIPAVMILAGAIFYERERSVPIVKWARVLGDASYSTYLAHPIPQAAISAVFGRLVHSPGATSLAALVALETIAAVIVGLAVYCTVEKPLLKQFGRTKKTL